MKTLFLVGLLTLGAHFTVVDAAEKSQEFWVNAEGRKITFHILTTRSETDPDYGTWLRSIVEVGLDVNYDKARGQLEPRPRLTPDPQKGDVVLEFTLTTNSKLDRTGLVKIVTDRLNQGGANYKEVKGPKKK